ncbi:hypothetical protein ABIC45_004076 [Mucilaginibacter rubeus]
MPNSFEFSRLDINSKLSDSEVNCDFAIQLTLNPTGTF